jgi:hypothetical protein
MYLLAIGRKLEGSFVNALPNHFSSTAVNVLSIISIPPKYVHNAHFRWVNMPSFSPAKIW